MRVHIEQLGPKDDAAARAFLETDVAQNLYLLGLVEEFGLSPPAGQPPFVVWGRKSGAQLTEVLFIGGGGGLVVPSSGKPENFAEIAREVGPEVKLGACLGEKAVVDVLVRHFLTGKPKVSREQRLHVVSADDLGPFTNPTLRPAVESDLPQLIPMAAAAVEERLGRDPLKEDLEGFQQRVAQRVRCKRTYVLPVEGQLVFKLDVGSRSQYGAELEGLYTLPAERRRGHATLSLGQISRHLLSSLPRLTLRVDEKDLALAGAARKVGYVGLKTQRLVVQDPA